MRMGFYGALETLLSCLRDTWISVCWRIVKANVMQRGLKEQEVFSSGRTVWTICRDYHAWGKQYVKSIEKGGYAL